MRIAPDLGFPGVAAAGGWWNRQHNPQIGIVAKNDERHAGIAFAGSIKWHEAQPFGLREYNALVRDVHSVPGVSDQTTLLAVARNSGCGRARILRFARAAAGGLGWPLAWGHGG